MASSSTATVQVRIAAHSNSLGALSPLINTSLPVDSERVSWKWVGSTGFATLEHGHSSWSRCCLHHLEKHCTYHTVWWERLFNTDRDSAGG